MVDPDFLTMFQFPFIKGNINTALNNPGNIVVTKKLAKKLFGNEDAMGKTDQGLITNIILRLPV